MSKEKSYFENLGRPLEEWEKPFEPDIVLIKWHKAKLSLLISNFIKKDYFYKDIENDVQYFCKGSHRLKATITDIYKFKLPKKLVVCGVLYKEGDPMYG